MAEQVGQLFCCEMIATHTEGCLDDADGKGLATIAEVGHIATLREKEFMFRILAIGRNETVEMILHLLEMRLAVPQGIVCVESNYFDWQSGHIPLIIRLEDFCSKPLGS